MTAWPRCEPSAHGLSGPLKPSTGISLIPNLARVSRHQVHRGRGGRVIILMFLRGERCRRRRALQLSPWQNTSESPKLLQMLIADP
eukprot:7453398-Pyramimonas_sp.AAC.1